MTAAAPATPAAPAAAAPAAPAAPATPATPAAPPAAAAPATPAAAAPATPGSLLESAGKTGEAPKPGEAKPGEAPKGAPESYTNFKMPEGVDLDKATLDKALPLFKKHNLSQEAAQEFVSFQAEHAKSTAETMLSEATKHRADQIAAWQAETKKALGAEWQKELGNAGKALDAFWPPEFRKMLTDSGLGDHPMMAAGLVKLGKMLAEAKPGEGGRQGIVDPKEATNRSMFPKMYDGNGNYIGGSAPAR